MKFETINTNGKNYISTEGVSVCPDYMLEMIKRTEPDVLVPFCTVEGEGKTKNMYCVDTDVSLADLLQEKGTDVEGMRKLMYSIDGLQAVCAEYMIDKDHLMLDPELIFTAGDITGARYVFNPFNKNDFNGSCRKLTANLLGNYFNGYSIRSEIFRERLIKETKKSSFNPRNILASWDKLDEQEAAPGKKQAQVMHEKNLRQPSLLANLKKRFSTAGPEDDETGMITEKGRGMFLTGICSIDTKIPVDEEGTTIGRGMLQKEYGLYNGSIGKSHARLYEQEGNIYISDLGSRNGTYLNGEKIEKRKPARIEKGDIIAFSDEEFILC